MKLARARFATDHYVASNNGLPRVGVVWVRTYGWEGPEGWKVIVYAGFHRFILRRSVYV